MARNDGVNRTTVRNQGMSKALGYDIWHYHLHVVYNTQRVQRNLGGVTPMEKFQMAFAA